MITYSNIDSAFKGVISDIMVNGDDVRPRGKRTKELAHASFALFDPGANILTNAARKLSHAYAVAEWLWILTGHRDVETIAPFNKRIADFSDDGQSFYGAYGPWVTSQLPYVVKTLKADPDSRQAVMTIWRQSPPPTKDVPCTVAIQYLLRGGRLMAQTFMRSNDAWLGLPYDVFTFTRLQAFVAAALGVPMGRYVHTVGSLHLYEQDWEKALIASRAPHHVARSPDLTWPLPRDLNERFEELAVLVPEIAGGAALDAPEPWGTYLGVLAWKRTGDRSFLKAPYDKIVTEAR